MTELELLRKTVADLQERVRALEARQPAKATINLPVEPVTHIEFVGQNMQPQRCPDHDFTRPLWHVTAVDDR